MDGSRSTSRANEALPRRLRDAATFASGAAFGLFVAVLWLRDAPGLRDSVQQMRDTVLLLLAVGLGLSALARRAARRREQP
jgi:hypothetical protein